MKGNLTLQQRIAYALGATGWVIGDRLIMTWGLFVYAPPEGEGLPDRLPEWSLLGVITVWGLISLFGRVLDSISDPLVASMSDRSTHPWGRRRVFMIAGVLPLTVATAGIFFAPVAERSWSNAAFAAAVFGVYFIAFTIYACPYQALLPDLTRTSDERLRLSTFQAAASLLGAGLVMIGSPLVLGALGDFDPIGRYRVMGVSFALLSLVFLLVPIVAVPETKLVARGEPSEIGLIESVTATFKAPGMGWYLVGTISFWFGFNTVASGVPYYVTVLMGREIEFGGVVLGATFGLTAVCFPLVVKLADRIGKRPTMMVGAVFLAVVMACVPLITGPLSGMIVMGLGGIPIAVLMAVPNAILSDLARAEAKRTGQNREAMFFGAQAFFMKVNLGLSAAVLAALLQLGKSTDNPLGVQMTGPATAGVLLLTLFAYWRFSEPPPEHWDSGDEAEAPA
jgi:GPH family glycoside/pentoside/hexuronide:cation symporter